MKTIQTLSIIALGLALTACGGKSTNTPSTETDSLSTENVIATTSDEIAQLNTPDEFEDAIEAAQASGDTEKVQAILNRWLEKMEELKASSDTEQLKEYAEELKDFYEDNKAQLAEYNITPEEINSKVTEAEAWVQENLNMSVEEMRDQATEKTEELTGKAKDKANDIYEKHHDEAVEKVRETTDKAQEKANKAIDKARAKYGF
ncbi:MAG: hypothetical protein SOU18_00585 [Alloprevotella sp.]|nr:hypothetical protein [Alloprevotella sp.]